MLVRACIWEAPLTHYVKGGWNEKVLFTENAKQVWYKKAPLSQYVKRDWDKRPLSTENVR